MIIKINAPGEDRTHDLQIMRLTRCLLRYQGTYELRKETKFTLSTKSLKASKYVTWQSEHPDI